MTIKSRLIGNVLVTATIVIVISLASYFSMNFIKEKLAYLTQKSTPFQIRTIELQRELQGCITNLIKVNSAKSMVEYATLRSDAEKSLENIANKQNALDEISSKSPAAIGDLTRIAIELFSASEERINCNVAAVATNEKVQLRMKESSARLKILETSVRKLQNNFSKAFAAALESTATSSGKLRSIEELRNLIRELQLISVSVQNIQNPTSVLIAKGKIKAITARIAKNDYYKTNKSIAGIVSGFADLLGEYLKLKGIAISQKDDGSHRKANEIGKDIPDKLGALFQTLDQETLLARDELAFAADRQRTIFLQSNSANEILVANSDLVALGLMVTSETNRLFNLESMPELEKLEGSIRVLFQRINERVLMLDNSLKKLNAKEELSILKTAATSLDAIRTELYSSNGILITLKKKLIAIEEANWSAEKLNTLVIRQSAKGNENIATAHLEQENAIIAVNNIIKSSTVQISVIALAAVFISIMFGLWVYRSILLPLRLVLDAVLNQKEHVNAKALLADAVASGDLSREVDITKPLVIDTALVKKDEIGLVLKAIIAMNTAQMTLDRAFAKMTGALRVSRDDEARRDRLKSGLNEFNVILRGEHENRELADLSLSFISDFLNIGVAVFYTYDEHKQMLHTISTYAIEKNDRLRKGFRIGEGLPGQAALEKKAILIDTVPTEYLPITSALGKSDPLHILIIPVMHNDKLAGVLELGSFRVFSNDDMKFLNQALEGVAIAMISNQSRKLVHDLMEQHKSYV